MKNFYLIKTVAVNTDNVILQPNNMTNFSNLQEFCFVICNNFQSSITSEPVQMYITVNGVNTPLKNVVGLPIYTNRINTRKRYKAVYVVTDDTSWVSVINTPCNMMYAES